MFEWLMTWGPCLGCGYLLALGGMALWMRVDSEDDPDDERELGGEAGGA